MATLLSSTLQLPKLNPPPLTFFPRPTLTPPPRKLPIPRVNTDEDSSAAPEPAPEADDDSFENRLYQVRLRNRSGTGKKAELRKSKKGKKTVSGSGSGSGSSIFLPPVALKEALSEGLNVEFGFSPYSERVNGRIAMLGLSALLAVELATGKGVINYHSPSIVFLQLYFVSAVYYYTDRSHLRKY